MSIKIVIITGSRDLLNKQVVWDALDEELPDLVVHGGCRGADHWAHLWCVKNETDERIFRARWFDGKRAGPLRNQRMCEAYTGTGALLIGFPQGDSRGTRDCIRRAKALGISTRVLEQ